MVYGEEEKEQWGCPNHPNTGYGYRPLRGNICTRCGHRITLLKGVWTANGN